MISPPDRTRTTRSLSNGRLPITLDSPGTWSFTYTDSNGKIVNKPITVGAGEVAKPETPVVEPKETQPEEQQVRRRIQADWTWLWLLFVLIALVIALAIFKKHKKR